MDAHAVTCDEKPILRVRTRDGDPVDSTAIDLEGLIDEFADLPDAAPVAEIVTGLLATGSFEDHTWERGMQVTYLCERPQALIAQLPGAGG